MPELSTDTDSKKISSPDRALLKLDAQIDSYQNLCRAEEEMNQYYIRRALLAIIHENCFLDETILNFKWLTRRVKTNFEYVVKLVNNFLYKVEIF